MTGNTFKITGTYDSPYNLNYNILGLHRKEYFVVGELQKVEYYTNYDGLTGWTNMILVENRVYTRDPTTDLVQYRTMIINFFLQDGTIGETKTTLKYYALQDQIYEGITRRTNVISTAKLYVMSQVGLANGEAYLVELITQINMYIQGSKQPLLDAVNASTDSFLTPTIIGTTIAILTFST